MKRRDPGGRPFDPQALRRTGVPMNILLPEDEKAAAARDAAARGLSLAAHVRSLLIEHRRGARRG